MHRSLPLHGDVAAATSPPRLALARKGFRPFFLLAGVFACAMVPVWLLVLFDVLRPTTYLDAVSWHAHEMIFGYAVAVIAGFLLTAVGNWTGRETVVGGKLLGLAAVWLLGRVAMTLPTSSMRGLMAVTDLAFIPLLTLALARPLVATRNRRNFVMLVVLTALFASNVTIHLEALGMASPGTGRHAALVAIDVIVFLCAVIAGRVVPMFTRNATGAPRIEAVPALEVFCILALIVMTLADVVAPASRVVAMAAGIAGIAAIARAVRWGTRHTLQHPLLWILHAGYGWIPIGLFLRATPLLGVPVMGSLAIHALTLGAIGALTLGMMARVALGHTGRALVPPKAMSAAFLFVTVAALVRVAGPALWPSGYATTLGVAGGLWTAAFVIYVVTYTSILTAARVDGKPG